MTEYEAEDMEEEADKEQDAVLDAEVVEEVSAHMKMGLTYQISPGTLKIKSSLHSQTKQEKNYIRTCVKQVYEKK